MVSYIWNILSLLPRKIYEYLAQGKMNYENKIYVSPNFRYKPTIHKSRKQ